MNVKLLAEHQLKFLSLKGGCTGSCESTLVKIQRCWKSHVMAHLISSHSWFLKTGTKFENVVFCK